MTGDQFGGLIRTIVAAAAGYFAGKGILDAETWTAIAGAAGVVGTAIWSFWIKKKTA